MTSLTLHGIPVSRGIAIGRAHLLTPAALEVKHYLINADQVEAEAVRLRQAIEAVIKELQMIEASLPKESPAELAAFLKVHGLLLADQTLSDAALLLIQERFYNAEWALLTQIDNLLAQFDEIEDPYLRERKADIRQIGDRILKMLMGSAAVLSPQKPEKASSATMIVVAHDIGPADMLQFRDCAVAGFITDLSAQNSHTAIVARSLDIPAVVGLSNASQLIVQNDWLIIDGDLGVVVIDPSALILEQYRQQQMKLLKARRKLDSLKKTPAVTLEGTPITLLANIEFPEDCEAALEDGAQGVGLLRSEFLFMNRAGHADLFPAEEEQFEFYRRAVVAMKGYPVTIRTLDSGADKSLDNAEQTALNPALGLRAIRYSLSEPSMFLTQLRAILRASASGPVKILIPMLAHAFEIEQTLALIKQAKQLLAERGQKFDAQVQIGAMIEIPAAALALPLFINRMDFLSIGTNDLIQYTLAVDRVDHEVAHLYDPLHPAVLQLVQNVITAGVQAGIPVAICGEMAGDTKLTCLLLGMGLREFSMHPSRLLSVKQEILKSDLTLLEPKVKKILTLFEQKALQAAVNQLRCS